MGIFINFVLAIAFIALGFVCISIEAEWWVALIMFGMGVIFVIVALYKLNDETDCFSRKFSNTTKKKVTIDNIVNHCLSLSYNKLEFYAGENYKKVYDHMTATYDKEKTNTLLIGSIFTCVAVDGKLSDKEWNFISSFIGGYSYDEAINVAGEFYNTEAQDIVKKLANFYPAEISVAFVKMCIAVLSVDKRISAKELNFIKNTFKI